MRKLKFKIDASKFSSRISAHTEMKKVFKKYEYYGNNLDALHDVLTSICRDAVITVSGLAASEKAIGTYAESIRKVFTDSAAENPNLTVEFTEPEQDA